MSPATRCLLLCGGMVVLFGCSDTPRARKEMNDAERRAKELEEQARQATSG